MPLAETIYETAQRALRPALERMDGPGPKLRRGVESRRHAVEAFEAWSVAHRDDRRPLLWLHAPSVGETLMAQAILAALVEDLPDAQFAFTYFSPSAERVASRVGADVAGTLPWDVTADVRRTLAALRPTAIAFVRTEIWPILTREARATRVPLALLNAVLSARSSRTRLGARLLLGPAYRRLDAVGAVARDDALRFRTLGVPDELLHVTGDARFDQVHARVQALDRQRPLLRRLADPDAVTVVAGSTWPADEERVVPALALASTGTGTRARLIIAPHEPDDVHLRALERTLAHQRIGYARLARIEESSTPLPDAIIVDRVGVLADLYAVADLAYVGGGFGRAGLHSVIEPAALRRPVVFGPHAGNAREAAELATAGGGFRVRDSDELSAVLSLLVGDADKRRAAGEAASRFVASKLGGARRNARLLVELLAVGR